MMGAMRAPAERCVVELIVAVLAAIHVVVDIFCVLVVFRGGEQTVDVAQRFLPHVRLLSLVWAPHVADVYRVRLGRLP